MEQQVSALEEALKTWALEVLKALKPAHPGQMVVHLDGRYLKGSARRGDRALRLVSAYLGQLGLSLWQGKALGDEAVAGRQLIMQLGPELSELGIPWVVTGDAAHTEAQTAAAILAKGGTTSSRSRRTRLP